MRFLVVVVQVVDLYVVRFCMYEIVVFDINFYVGRVGFISCEEDKIFDRWVGNVFYRILVFCSVCFVYVCLFIQYVLDEFVVVKVGSCCFVLFVWCID